MIKSQPRRAVANPRANGTASGVPVRCSFTRLADLAELKPNPANPNKHPDSQLDLLGRVIEKQGWRRPPVVSLQSGFLVTGHGSVQAAQRMGWAIVPIDEQEFSTPAEETAHMLADNKLPELAELDMEAAAALVRDLEGSGFDLDLTGFTGDDLDGLLSTLSDPASVDAQPETDRAAELQKEWGTEPGQLWQLGEHRLMCGDCSEPEDVEALVGKLEINLGFTSPPYASQREYDPASGFKPIRPEEYSAWWEPIQKLVADHLAKDGSFFVNIKEHCHDGQRHLYVKELTIDHVRKFGWRFVDEFCWRDTKNGVPGGWENRCKDAWEPVFHFTRSQKIKFHPLANGVQSEAVFESSSRTQKTKTGSGLLGVKGSAEKSGVARPSNVIELAASSTGGHPAAFPIGLPAWFIRAFSDETDIVYEPFAGSGTTLMACEQLGRRCRAMEISPAYVAVALQRFTDSTGKKPVLRHG